MIRSHSVQMKLALPARASKPITPVSHPARKRKIGVRLSHYSALYDLQNELTRKSFAPAEPAHFGHIVHGAATAFGPLYFATFCALSVTLGALLFNLTNVLNEYFAIQQQLLRKPEERPLLYGVDVSGSKMFRQPQVKKAVEFAAAAHAGQKRKTGEPYVSHCIETALIVEANLPHWRQDSRHEAAVIAALLHDTLDDTPTTVEQITAAFGPAVAAMVVKVSKLSQVNQMLRRDKRKGVVTSEPSYWQSQWSRLKRMMFEAVVEEPLVILVKLADRLHNMRTVYALSPDKQRAVAEETQAVWCSMAASLGWHRLKSEMEDLCFAVADQASYCTLRQQLDKLWSCPPAPRSRRKVRSTRRQQQLQHFAAQQQAMAASRVGIWQCMGQSLRDLRGMLGYGTRAMPAASHHSTTGRPTATTAVTSNPYQESGISTVAGRQHVSDCVDAVVATSSEQSNSIVRSQDQQQEQQKLEGLSLLPRLWQSSASPLLPAPAEEGERDHVEPQRAAGGEWGVTDAAVSLKALLGTSRWAASRRQQQQQLPAVDDSGSSIHPQNARAAAGKKATQQRGLTPQQEQLRNVLSTVVPFDAVSITGNKGLPWSAQQGLRVLEEAAERLYTELAVGSFSSGLQVEIQGRLKSVRSVYNKMMRKNCSMEEVYDARALRVVVDDAGGKRLADAVQCCYRLVSAVHKLWHPIHGEFDDYIANPKPSGYQALHTAVWGPGGAALEVQIKTSGMHEHAEYGGAAHWAYKEVLWGSAPAAAAAVQALEVSRGAGSSSESMAAAQRTAAAVPVQSLPAVTFSFDERGRLLNSSVAAAAAADGTSDSSTSSNGTGMYQGYELDELSSVSAVAVGSSKSMSRQGVVQQLLTTAVADGGSGSSRRVTTATAVAQAEPASRQQQSSLLARIAALNQQQQAQEPATTTPVAAAAVKQSGRVQMLNPPKISSSIAEQVSSSSNAQHSSPAAVGTKQQSGHQPHFPLLSVQQQQQQQQPSQLKPAPHVYVGQPILRISDRLRYGVVLGVINNNSSSSPAAGPAFSTWTSSSSSISGGSNTGSSSSSSPGSTSLLCVIMSGGTNPDHPWRMPDYGFYHQLLKYATAAEWMRPGQGDWHARLEEFDWCRDGRWHRRDHMGYLHPHTTLTLLEGYEHDAAEAAAVERSNQFLSSVSCRPTGQAAVSAAAADADASTNTVDSSVGNVSSSNSRYLPGPSKSGQRKDATLLLHSWATGGSWLPPQTAAALEAEKDSRKRVRRTTVNTSSSGVLQEQQQQQQKKGDASAAAAAGGIVPAVSPDSGAAASASAGGGGSDWAATAAMAAQLRSVIEWGQEAYGVEGQQGSEVSVLIWPGGTIEDVPRGTTAGQILQQKGVFAILDSATDSDSEQPQEQQRYSDSSNNPAVELGELQQQRQWRTGSSIAEMLESQEQQQCRLVNVNNRLVSEDTVLSDGDLVILARERIKI